MKKQSLGDANVCRASRLIDEKAYRWLSGRQKASVQIISLNVPPATESSGTVDQSWFSHAYRL
jgi:hypothetical protein